MTHHGVIVMADWNKHARRVGWDGYGYKEEDILDFFSDYVFSVIREQMRAAQECWGVGWC